MVSLHQCGLSEEWSSTLSGAAQVGESPFLCYLQAIIKKQDKQKSDNLEVNAKVLAFFVLDRQHAKAQPPTRPRTSNRVASLHIPPLAQCRGSAAKMGLDYRCTLSVIT